MAQLGTVLLGLTDTIMLGRFGKNELAAAGLSNQIFFLTSVLGIGVMTALTPIVASSKGAKNQRECGEFLRSGIELGVIVGFFTFLALIVLSFNLDILRQSEEVNRLSGRYLRVLASTVFPFYLFLALKHFNDGLSFTRPAMVITFFGVLANVAFNWVFIFGNLTFPEMGTTGAAIATLLTRLLMAGALVIYIFRSQAVKIFLPPLVSTYKTAPVIRKLIKMGLPTGLQIFFEVAAYASVSVFAGWVSLSALAAHQIGLGIIAFCYTIATGFCAAGSVLTGQALGEKQSKFRLKEIGYATMLVSTSFLIVTSIMLLAFKSDIIKMFTLENEVIDLALKVFGIWVAFQLVNGVQATVIGLLRGIQDVSIPAILTLISYWLIGVPLSLILITGTPTGLNGIWLGLCVGLGLCFLILSGRFFILLKNGSFKTYHAETLETA